MIPIEINVKTTKQDTDLKQKPKTSLIKSLKPKKKEKSKAKNIKSKDT